MLIFSTLSGTLGTDPNKKTLLIYGHLDVQPAMVSDGWDTEPFKLIEKDFALDQMKQFEFFGQESGFASIYEIKLIEQ